MDLPTPRWTSWPSTGGRGARIGWKSFAGRRGGFAANFLSLVCHPEITADYFSYADQDDVWEKDKLARAIGQLEKLAGDGPKLYCSRTALVDEDGSPLGVSPLFTQKPDFRNALVQNIGGGNTMVFNAAARLVLMRAGSDLDIVAHDWWTYLAVTAVGGRVVYDPSPTLRYRQHGRNLIGSNRGLQANFFRAGRLLRGQLGLWIDANAVGVKRLLSAMPSSNRDIFSEFQSSRRGGSMHRIRGLKRSGVYRQTFSGNMALIVAAFFKKL